MLTLRKLEPSDLPYLYQWENDAAMWSDADTHNPLSQQDLRDYIGSTTGDLYRDGQLRLIIEQQTETERMTIGCVDLFDLDVRNRKAAIGLYIAPAYRGQGLGRQTVEELEKYAFGFLQLRLLYAIIATRNEASSALYLAAGYTPSSVLSHWTIESDAILWWKTNPQEMQK